MSGLLAFCLVAGLVVPAFAQDSDLSNRLRRLENDMETLSRAVYKGETPPAGSYSGGASGTDTEMRLQQMEATLSEMRGKLEEQGFEVRQLRDQMTRINSDVDMRLSELEGNARPASGGAAGGSSTSGMVTQAPPYPQTGSNEPETGGGYQWGTNNATGNTGGQQLGSYDQSPSGANAPASGDTAADLYENAFSLLKNNNYDQAQVEFSQFLEQYPDHTLAGNAKYWLGETYYVRGKYDDAARVFAEGYQKYPKSPKAADNLLKLGLSLDALGKKQDACIALKQLQKENLTGAAPVMRRAEQEMTRLQCE